ncbi:MAG: tetratricopeptide repeat protein [Brevundimonas sp.]|nr:MAG: tetratricopeptide repeat protein [Brevundimonas sp.]
MVDLFEEVEEELRVEQYKKLAVRLAPWVIGGLVAGIIIAGAIYGIVRYQESNAAKASAAYSAVLEKLAQGDNEGAIKQLQLVPKGSKAYRALALSLQGGLLIEEGRTAEGVKLLDESATAAPGGKAGLILADSARLKAAWAVLDDAPYAEVEKRLQPLTEDGRPYSALAKEAMGMALINAGRAKEAKPIFTKLSVDPSAPQSMAQRAKIAADLIDGGAASAIPAAAKAAKSIAPPAPQPTSGITPEMIEQLRAQAAAQGAAQAPAGAAQ